MNKMEISIQRLYDEQIDYDQKSPNHLIVTDFQGKLIDFWPSTGKFIPRDYKDRTSSGLNNLIRYIKTKG